MTDETSGTLWKIPKSSILLSHPNANVPSKSWLNFIDHAKRDAYTFVNAEVIRDLQRHVQAPPPLVPGHVLASGSGETPRVVYTQSITISHSHFKNYASAFHWALSFEQHAEVFTQAQTTGSRPLLDLGVPMEPKLSSLYHQRPCPSAIHGATRVVDFASEITAEEREFFASVSCAPYLFRDCSYSLEQYWKSTRLHKEHFPSRMALKTRIGREDELRNLRNVRGLLEKAQDPTIEKLVLENAKNGMKVLNELMDVTNGVVCAKRKRIIGRSDHQSTTFFGDAGLPYEIQSKILLVCVKEAFANPDCRATQREYASIRSTCRAFELDATLLGNRQISGAIHDLQRFVSTGTMASCKMKLGSWTYKEFACPPSMLLRGIPERTPNNHMSLIYIRERMRANLSENICKERAKAVRPVNEAPRPKSARLDRLLRIACEMESV